MILLIAILLTRPQLFSVEASDLVIQALHRAGYPAERYEIETSDGYIITTHRIPPKNNNISQADVVILMHGIIGSAADFVLTGKDRGLGNILHDEGYDVWIPNARGTTWSRKHRKLSPQSPEFWNFSWHEIGLYDIPAVVDVAISNTGRKKVHYAAHSQGSTALLVLLSMKPEYNDKIASASLLAPIAFIGNIQSPILRLVAAKTDDFEKILTSLGFYEFLPSNTLTQVSGRFLCGDQAPTQELCLQLTYCFVGFSDYPFNRTVLADMVETTPAGISYKQVSHFGQLIQSGKFHQYDYRTPGRNLLVYGKKQPPAYRLKNVRIPMQMFYGNRDLLLAKQDVLLLKSALTHTSPKFLEIRGFNHIDFLYGTEAPRIVYRKILTYLRSFVSRTRN